MGPNSVEKMVGSNEDIPNLNRDWKVCVFMSQDRMQLVRNVNNARIAMPKKVMETPAWKIASSALFFFFRRGRTSSAVRPNGKGCTDGGLVCARRVLLRGVHGGGRVRVYERQHVRSRCLCSRCTDATSGETNSALLSHTSSIDDPLYSWVEVFFTDDHKTSKVKQKSTAPLTSSRRAMVFHR